jgi:hypothetical protein
MLINQRSIVAKDLSVAGDSNNASNRQQIFWKIRYADKTGSSVNAEVIIGNQAIVSLVSLPMIAKCKRPSVRDLFHTSHKKHWIHGPYIQEGRQPREVDFDV